jgi:hypothetical protein
VERGVVLVRVRGVVGVESECSRLLVLVVLFQHQPPALDEALERRAVDEDGDSALT